MVVGDILPLRDTSLNISNYKVCAHHDMNFDAGATVFLPCDATVRGRYLIIVIPAERYLTLCEVQVFGERGLYVKQYHKH